MKRRMRIKQLSRFIVLGLWIVLVGTRCDKEKPRAETQTSAPSILFLGDSLTAGLGLEKFQAAPALIEEMIHEKGWNLRVINGGVSGDTTAGGLSRLEWYLRKENRIQYVVVGLGANDGMRGLSIDAMKTNLKKIIEQIRSFDSKITIFLYEMHTFPSMGPQYANKFHQAFPDVARETDVILVPFPLKGVAGIESLNQDDGIHPTAEGTKIYARNVWNTLEPVLARDMGKAPSSEE